MKRFWNLFGPDYRDNCLAWERSPHNPVIPATGDSWKSHWTANPDTLEFGGRVLLYYRGNGIMPDTDGYRHDRIAVAELLDVTTDNIEFEDLADGQPVIDVGEPGMFDYIHVLDPSAVHFQDTIFLYYTAAGEGPVSVGLAVSSDGIEFEKVGRIVTGRAPSAVVLEDGIALLYQVPDAEGRQEFFMGFASDGINFELMHDEPVFAPTEAEQGWDSFDISTGRLYPYEDGFMMIYGGSSSLIDQPDYFGLARSSDLIEWERHPGNPIFGCGPKGSEDGGAIWFPALIETETHFVLLYEGSRGDYRGDLSSQICMSSVNKTFRAPDIVGSSSRSFRR